MLQDQARETGLYSPDTAGFEKSVSITRGLFCFAFKENVWEQANKEKATFERLLLRIQSLAVCIRQTSR